MGSDEIDRMGLLKDIRFDYDSADIREADRQVLTENAEVLKKFDFIRVTIEGHCDERGTVEYNLALGERRARAASDYLVSLGVGADRLKTVSYGKEVPVVPAVQRGLLGAEPPRPLRGHRQSPVAHAPAGEPCVPMSEPESKPRVRAPIKEI